MSSGHRFIRFIGLMISFCEIATLNRPFLRGRGAAASTLNGSQSVSQGFICEIITKRANTCDPTIEEYVYSSRSSLIWCLGLVWSACAYRVPCLPKLVLF